VCHLQLNPNSTKIIITRPFHIHGGNICTDFFDTFHVMKDKSLPINMFHVTVQYRTANENSCDGNMVG